MTAWNVPTTISRARWLPPLGLGCILAILAKAFDPPAGVVFLAASACAVVLGHAITEKPTVIGALLVAPVAVVAGLHAAMRSVLLLSTTVVASVFVAATLAIMAGAGALARRERQAGPGVEGRWTPPRDGGREN
jgi:hypothetical protein